MREREGATGPYPHRCATCRGDVVLQGRHRIMAAVASHGKGRERGKGGRTEEEVLPCWRRRRVAPASLAPGGDACRVGRTREKERRVREKGK